MLFLSLLLLFQTMQAQIYKKESPLVHTYSIVAYDSITGDMGAAVQSHWFSVGSIVIWGEAGVGVVATQSFVNVSFGVRGLALLKSGLTPQDALDSLLSDDPGREMRQVAILNNKGEVATFTGSKCVAEAGHIKGKYYSVQANMMKNSTVWQAMSTAFEITKAPLAERMMAALEAAEAQGGDIRGKQSAALIVVRAKPTGNVWEDRIVDIRVDDNSEPVKELKRILHVYRAYEHMNAGDLAIENNLIEKALMEYSAAENLMPNNLEMKYWHAVSLANLGKIEDALPLFKYIFEKDENWKIMTPRLVPVGLLTVTEKDLKKILSQ